MPGRTMAVRTSPPRESAAHELFMLRAPRDKWRRLERRVLRGGTIRVPQHPHARCVDETRGLTLVESVSGRAQQSFDGAAVDVYRLLRAIVRGVHDDVGFFGKRHITGRLREFADEGTTTPERNVFGLFRIANERGHVCPARSDASRIADPM